MTVNGTTSRPGRLTVGIVGAGRVGSALGVALQRAGHRVIAGSAISTQSVQRLRRRLPDLELLPVEQVVAKTELVLLAVPDDDLSVVIRGLSDLRAWQAGQLVAHVSGAYGLEVLAPAIRSQILPMALHPVMTFTGRDEDLDRMAGISYGVTAPEQLRPIAEALVVEMGGEPAWIEDAQRPLYHAALTIGANYLVTLIAESAELLRKSGVSNPNVMLAPLVGAAVDNALRLGDAGLTGPVARGDARTVEKHIAALQQHADDSVPSYLAMARHTAARALAAGQLQPREAENLLEALQNPKDSPQGSAA